MIKFCKRCQEEKCNCCPSGYYFGWKDSVRNCPNCGYEFRDIDFPKEDLSIIEELSNDTLFIEAMIKLRQDNIIEYESRMSQFRIQVQQQEQLEQKRSNNIPKCPTCGSTNIRPISGTERAVSVIGLGLFSKKINKTYKCLNCKHTW